MNRHSQTKLSVQMLMATTKGEYREMLKELSFLSPNFWTACAFCAVRKSEIVVVDDYFESLESAKAAGMEYGVKVCAPCSRSYFEGSEFLVRRAKVSLFKKPKCVGNGEKECYRIGRFFVTAFGKRRMMCMEHVAIHSVYTTVSRVDRRGFIENVTEGAYHFYANHIRRAWYG